MNLNQFLILALLTIGLSSQRATGFAILQDSTKKVSIKVIATEKSRDLDFDSLLRARSNLSQVRTTEDRPEPKLSVAHKSLNTKKTAGNTSPISEQKPAGDQKSSSNAQTVQDIVQNSAEKTENKERTTVADTTSNFDNAEVIKDSNPATISSEDKASRTYLWVGCMLFVAGIILAILFGKTALLISLAGLIFAIIGYSFKS